MPLPGAPWAVGRRDGVRGGGGFPGIGSCFPSAGLGRLTGASWSRGPPLGCASQLPSAGNGSPHSLVESYWMVQLAESPLEPGAEAQSLQMEGAASCQEDGGPAG